MPGAGIAISNRIGILIYMIEANGTHVSFVRTGSHDDIFS
jgi:mRNA-degrading endonuclease YafQ of YafQ-DinJ toxin-antitoxin module